MNEKPWKQCQLCPNETFTSPYQFGDHLRSLHSKKEGGSHICKFGPNEICPLLPCEGVSDRDYETHIAKCHIFAFQKPSFTLPQSQSTRAENDSKTRSNDQSNSKAAYKEKRLSNFPSPSTNGLLGDYLAFKNDRPNVIEGNEWTIYSSSQNLTSVLNDPSKARSYFDNLFTKDWGFQFVDPSIVAPYHTAKKPSQMLFESYVKKLKESRRNKRYIDKSSSSSIQSDLVSYESKAQTSVPSLFFDDNFNLEDSETFVNLLALFGSNKNDDSLERFFNQRSMNDIQALLSEYLDTTEQDLAQQICKRSKDFFHVMSSMDLVMEKLKVSIKQVTTIRENCHGLENDLVRPIETNIELTQLRNKYRDIFKKINWIATVHQTQPTIQLLLSKNDYAGSLDLISTSQEVVAQELSGVISFRHLKLQLMEIEKVIEQMMNEEFVKYLTAEWNRPLTDDTKDNIQEERLLSIIYGMLKLQKFNFIDTFREEAFTAIKTNVKQTVIETLSSEDNIEVSRIDSSLYEQTKCLKFHKWLACLRTVFSRLITLLKRVDLVYNVINNGFVAVANNSSSNTSNTTRSLQPNSNSVVETTASNRSEMDDLHLKVILQSDYYELSANLKEILCSICDFAHSRCAQIIELRVNDGSLDRLDPSEFLQLIQLIEGFANDCEAISGKKSPNLKLVIQIQSNKFVTRFHDERKRKLIQLLDLEQWKSASNLSEDFQSLCTELVNLVDKSTSLGEVYSRFKNSKSSPGFKSSPKFADYLMLNNEKFVLVNAVINLVYMILEYCEYAQEISFLSPDLLLRLIDLLKLFNSRTSQLILGAEALQVAGLKTISARTLIISLRSLTFVVQLVPSIRRHFEALLVNRQANMLKHFDELLELYENHQSKIPDKVIGLVKDVVGSNLGKWVAKVPVPSVSFQTISQHLTRLHDNIQGIMPHHELVSLFNDIHHTVILIFRAQLQKLKIVNDGGPQHGLVTQELTFYTQSLGKLSIGNQLNLSTADLWSKV